MILGLTEPVFIRRAWLATLGVPCAAAFAGLVGFFIASTHLNPLLDGRLDAEVGQLRNACLLTVLPPIAIYCVGSWLTGLWRKRYAPKCPVCAAEFACYAQTVVQTRRCWLCCADLDEPDGTGATAVGMTRDEFSRRLRVLNDQFACGILMAMVPTSVAGTWLIGSVVVNPLGINGVTPDQSTLWLAAACFAWFVGAMVWLRKARLRQVKSFNLECPKCGAPLPNAMPSVAATGQCGQCHAVVLI